MNSGGPYILGMTGGIGCGKSTVAKLFEAHGASVVDTDEVAHALTAPGGAAMPALEAAFGAEIVSPDGALNRGAMRRMAFADPAIRQHLEAILHPLIRAHGEQWMTRAAGPYIVLIVPLLVESTYYRSRCDRILSIECPPALQITRVMARSGLSAAEVERIMAAQASPAARRAIADDIIDNAGDLAALQIQVSTLHQRLSVLAEAKRTRQSVL